MDSISYTNFPGTGFYDKVTKMIAATGQCETEKYSYSGSLAPLNEEVRTPTHHQLQITMLIVVTTAVYPHPRSHLAQGTGCVYPKLCCGQAFE